MADLTPADQAILRVLREGRATQGYIVSESGFSRPHIHNRLQLMEAYGYARNIHEPTALWTITDEAPVPPFDDEDTETEDKNGEAN